MSKNKLSKFAENEQFTHVFQISSAALREGKTFDLRGKWCDFFGNDNPIIVELGCGKGEYTVSLAERFPNKNFIGVDIKGARIWSGAKKSFEAGMSNVAFLRGDIEMITYFFAENEISEIWLTFPDPQMKKATKRLTSSNFMQMYEKVLVPQGIIHLKTDSNFMYSYTVEMVKANNLPVIFFTDNLYAKSLPDKILEIKTFYEQQWLARSLTIKYIAFALEHRKKFLEPNIEIEKDDYRSFGRNGKI